MQALSLAPPLHALLARVFELTPTARDVMPDRELHAVEQALGTIVPDAVVALVLAAGWTPHRLIEETELRVAYAVATFDKAVSRAHPQIAFDSWGDSPKTSVGFAPTRSRDEPVLIWWDWKTWSAVPDAPTTIEGFVRARLGELDLATPASAAAIARFAPRVASVAAAPVFVVHPKFGRGRVKRQIDDKLEIDFGPHGIRTLLARFVTREP